MSCKTQSPKLLQRPLKRTPKSETLSDLLTVIISKPTLLTILAITYHLSLISKKVVPAYYLVAVISKTSTIQLSHGDAALFQHNG